MTAITLIQESNFTRRESPELLIRVWMLSKRVASMITGISMGQEICLIIGLVHSVYSIRRETSRRIYVVRGETDEKAANIQTRSFVARTLDEMGKKCPAEGAAKVVT